MRRRRQSFRNSWIAIRASPGDESARCASRGMVSGRGSHWPEEQIDPGMGANRQPARPIEERAGSSNARSQDGRLRERVEKRFCRFEVGRAEAFSEPVVDRLEECDRISRTTLIAQQPGKARSGAQFPRERALPARPVEGLPEMTLGRRRGSRRALQQNKLALDA